MVGGPLDAALRPSKDRSPFPGESQGERGSRRDRGAAVARSRTWICCAPDALDRRRQAVELRLAGHTYQLIADQLGYRGHTGARAAVEKALRDAIREPSEEVITMELQRLDAVRPTSRQNVRRSVSRRPGAGRAAGSAIDGRSAPRAPRAAAVDHVKTRCRLRAPTAPRRGWEVVLGWLGRLSQSLTPMTTASPATRSAGG